MDHLKQTLPLLAEVENSSCVVVDYGCPQGSGLWVQENFPSMRVQLVTDDQGFCLSRARNIGAAATESPWLCFIDADTRITKRFTEWLGAARQSNEFYRGGIGNKDTWGTLVCSRAAFDTISGYDEIFRGWGGEDDEIYIRLRAAGGVEKYLSAEYFSPISHDDGLRTKFHVIKDRQLQSRVNSLYIYVKMDVQLFSPRFLTLEGRRAIMAEVTKAVLSASDQGVNAHVEVELENASRVPQPPEWRVSRRIVYDVIEPTSHYQQPTAPSTQRPVSANDNRVTVGNGAGLNLNLVVIPSEQTKTLANEIFLNRCYTAPPLTNSPTTIVDIGAGVGLTAAYFRLIYPQASIFCFESDAELLPILQTNLVAIGKAVVNPKESTSHATGSATALDALAFLPQIDILKIASAASNLPILSSLRPRLGEVAVIYVEFSSVATRDKTTTLLGEALHKSHALWKVQVLASESGTRGLLIYTKISGTPANNES